MWTKTNISNLSGKTAIVTGANTGVGFETALALYEAGADVVLACRNIASAEDAILNIKDQIKTTASSLEAAHMDLSDLTSVKQFVEWFLQNHTRLDILINNAGVMYTPESKTAQGYELQFGTNFLGHFALTGRLYPILKNTPGARVVTVSSNAYLRGAIDFDNLRSEKSYDPVREYNQSKLGNILFSLELDRRLKAERANVTSIAAQPGANRTGLSKHMSEEDYANAVKRVGELMEPRQGALPSLYAAVSDEALGGRLYGPDQDGGYRGYPAKAEIQPHGLDKAVAKKLWNWAEEATGIQFPN